MVSTKDPTTTRAGVSVQIIDPTAAPGTTVSPVSDTEEPRVGGLGVGLMVLIMFTITILTALADTAFNGSITYITGVVFVVLAVICAALIRYDALSTTIITPPLAFFTAILIAGQPDLLDGVTDNLLIREVAMLVAGLAFNAPWIFAGTGSAMLIVIMRRWIIRR